MRVREAQTPLSLWAQIYGASFSSLGWNGGAPKPASLFTLTSSCARGVMAGGGGGQGLG